ncbi:HAD family phosphatase [Nonomuraea sp. NPDC050310]|uniref:HAD family hydrolase n=1 Tax=unclassified Nonomuraea TaxID=2593643 RepID=UPI0033D42221
MVKGILIDWGGVLTSPMGVSIAHWLEADRIDAAHYRQVMRRLITEAYSEDGGHNVVHALERGELGAAEFERLLAAELLTLDGTPPPAEGLINRMFAGFAREEAMYGMLREARSRGLKTCLLSNSWANDYPREDWPELFDAVVISGEIGMRKPEPRIFHHALGLIGLEAADCVFIDDIEANILAGTGLGLRGIHHRDAVATIAELETLLSSPLA